MLTAREGSTRSASVPKNRTIVQKNSSRMTRRRRLLTNVRLLDRNEPGRAETRNSIQLCRSGGMLTIRRLNPTVITPRPTVPPTRKCDRSIPCPGHAFSPPKMDPCEWPCLMPGYYTVSLLKASKAATL